MCLPTSTANKCQPLSPHHMQETIRLTRYTGSSHSNWNTADSTCCHAATVAAPYTGAAYFCSSQSIAGCVALLKSSRLWKWRCCLWWFSTQRHVCVCRTTHVSSTQTLAAWQLWQLLLRSVVPCPARTQPTKLPPPPPLQHNAPVAPAQVDQAVCDHTSSCLCLCMWVCGVHANNVGG